MTGEFPFGKAYLKQIEGGRGATTDPVTIEVTPDARILVVTDRDEMDKQIEGVITRDDTKVPA